METKNPRSNGRTLDERKEVAIGIIHDFKYDPSFILRIKSAENKTQISSILSQARHCKDDEEAKIEREIYLYSIRHRVKEGGYL